MQDAADPLFSRAQARIGAILNQKYRLDRLLGVGGMAAVYLATHRNGNRVALKMLHRELSLDAEARSRFLLEGYAANNLDHPGTVRVLDDDAVEDGSVFLVMELLEGETLEQRAAASGGTLPPRTVMDLAHGLLDVLAAALDKGIVHRDIKPQNLFITSEGALKVLDFGLARVQDTRTPHATRSGQVFGTPAFMPPEQALGKINQIDHRSDLWAVGATMFTLLSGRYVHEAETSAEHVVFAASRPARSLAQAAPHVPAPIVALVDRALQFSRADRWQSARDMQRALEEAYLLLYREPPPPRRGARASQPFMVAATGAGVSQTSTPIRPERARVWRRAAWVAAPLAALAAVIAAWAAASDDPPLPEAPAIGSAAGPEPAPPASTSVEPATSAPLPETPAPHGSTKPAAAGTGAVRPVRTRPVQPPPVPTGSFDRQ